MSASEAFVENDHALPRGLFCDGSEYYNQMIGVVAYLNFRPPKVNMAKSSRTSPEDRGICESVAIYVTVALLRAVRIEVDTFNVTPEGVTAASGASMET